MPAGNNLGRSELSVGMPGKEDAVNDSDAILDGALTGEISVTWAGADALKTLSSAQMQTNVAFRMVGTTTEPAPVLKLADVQRGFLIVINELATAIDVTDFDEIDTINVVSGQTIALYATGQGVQEVQASSTVGGTLDTLSDGPGSYAAAGSKLVAINAGGTGFEYVSVLDLQFKYLKQPCRAATTAAITISTALNNGDSLDGVTLATGDRVLVKNQAAQSENGIYVVGASPARATDMDADAETVGGTIVTVMEGTANADTAWILTTNGAIVVGTDAINFSNFGVSASALTSNVTANLTVGFTATSYNAGTKSSGTFTPDSTLGGFQRAVNDGAHALGVPTTGAGDSATLILQYTNGAAAGALDVTAFTVSDMTAYNTTNGNDFFFNITVCNGFSSIVAVALQ